MYFPVYPKQMEFLDAPEFVKGFVGGQGSGKTKIGAWDMLRRVRPGRTYAVVTPTYPMLRDATFRTFREVGEQSGQWQAERFNKTEFTAHVLTQTNPVGVAEVLFRSAHDPDRLRGPNLSGVWMDEASLLEHEAYQICIARLREKNEQGWLTCTFTPKGKLHWTYADVFGPPKSGQVGFAQRLGVKLVHASTRDNPFVAPGFVERVYTEYSGLRSQQELGGEFVSVEGAEWPPEYFPPTMMFNAFPGDLIVKAVALDPSKGKLDKPGDYAAIVWGGVDKSGTLWVDAELTKSKTTTQQLDRLVELNHDFQPLGIGVEKVMFQELMAQELVRRGREQGIVLPVFGMPNSLNKQVRIRSLTPHLSQGRLRVRDAHEERCKGGTCRCGRLLVQQLMEFPEAAHDDGPDALEQFARLIMHLLTNKVGRDRPVAVAG